ncbi:GNAT family N-acetyltransferase [Paenibacillus illinoisensis]|uniref:GNAT family N-acetyltransferase n=1 Tax=Paenibacillus illinoisensis TaxID=59845 RepID=UPI000FD8282E|nr:GNAT family N-acetyltransferase [Paenibacillus illinoisensis]
MKLENWEPPRTAVGVKNRVGRLKALGNADKSVTDLSGNSCDKSYPCREMLFYWENEMKQRGFKQLMTSTMSNEGAQHFYRKLGCRYAGGLLLNDEPLEILLAKTIL